MARKLAAAIRAREQGLPQPAERQTVASFLAGWLESVKPSLRPHTWTRYEGLIRVHALPNIGRLPLAKVTPDRLQKLYANRLEAGQSAASVRQLHAVLHRAFRQAVRWGVVARNVADLVTPPRVKRREMQALSPEQSRVFLTASHGDRLEALFVLAISTGMRQGELLGLRWRDVDLDAGLLAVRGSLSRTPDGLTIAEPKTARSRRQIELTATAIEALRRHRASQAEARLKLGASWADMDLVFTNEIGGYLSESHMRRRSFWPLLERADLPRIRFHELRHTAATLMLGRGINPKIVSEMLGHAQISVTLDLYSHVTPTMQREAAEALDAVFHG